MGFRRSNRCRDQDLPLHPSALGLFKSKACSCSAMFLISAWPQNGPHTLLLLRTHPSRWRTYCSALELAQPPDAVPWQSIINFRWCILTIATGGYRRESLPLFVNLPPVKRESYVVVRLPNRSQPQPASRPFLVRGRLERANSNSRHRKEDNSSGRASESEAMPVEPEAVNGLVPEGRIRRVATTRYLHWAPDEEKCSADFSARLSRLALGPANFSAKWGQVNNE
jgi:hypothetical protein